MRRLTVATLIKRLQTLPPNAIVVRWDGNEEHSLATEVVVHKLSDLYTYNCDGRNRLHSMKRTHPESEAVEIK